MNPTRDRATNELSARALINTADGPFRALRDDGLPPDLPALLAGTTQPLLILRADPEYGGALNEQGRDELLAARPGRPTGRVPKHRPPDPRRARGAIHRGGRGVLAGVMAGGGGWRVLRWQAVENRASGRSRRHENPPSRVRPAGGRGG